jgi:endoglycosylceramidase
VTSLIGMGVRRMAWLVLLSNGCGVSETAVETHRLALDSAAVRTRKLRVDGARLLDELGREVVLRGFNVGGRAKMPPHLPFELPAGTSVVDAADAYFARIAALGANHVRLTFAWEAYEPTRGTYDAGYLAQYETLLDAADANGIAVVVDFHQDVFASAFCGDGFPLWALGPIQHGPPHYDCGFPWWSFSAFNPLSATNAAFDRLWHDRDGLQSAMEAMWRRVAARFATHPAVAAFEVMNEPVAGTIPSERFDAEVLPAFYERMGRAIREAAGDFPIFIDPRMAVVGIPRGFRLPALPGVVYAPHYYEAFAMMSVPWVRHHVIRKDLDATFAALSTWSVPVYLGEYGVPNHNLAKASYLDAVLDRVDFYRGHAAMWDASMSPTLWNGEDFSVFTASGAEQPWVDASVVRAYPRAVAGRIVSFTWDGDRKRFDLAVSDSQSGTTEIYLPRRHLGDNPHVTVTGGASFHFDAATELLWVAAPLGSSYAVSVVR